MYWPRAQERHGAMGWNWVEPEGLAPLVGYPPGMDRKSLIQECHEGRKEGHLGVDCTMQMIQQNSYWPGMSKQVRVCTAACEGCQSWKPVRFSRR